MSTKETRGSFKKDQLGEKETEKDSRNLILSTAHMASFLSSSLSLNGLRLIKMRLLLTAAN